MGDFLLVVMGARKNRLHEDRGMSHSFHVITFKWGLRDPGYNLLQKKMLCFVVITDGFRNINAHVEAKQARKEKKKTWNKWGAFYCEKLMKLSINLSYLSVLLSSWIYLG